jgi:hypothetical protein
VNSRSSVQVRVSAQIPDTTPVASRREAVELDVTQAGNNVATPRLWLSSSVRPARVRHQDIADVREQVVIGRREGTQREARRSIVIKGKPLESIRLVRPLEVGNALEFGDDRWLDRSIHPGHRLDATSIQACLPSRREGHGQVPTDELGPVQRVTRGGCKDTRPIASLAE